MAAPPLLNASRAEPDNDLIHPWCGGFGPSSPLQNQAPLRDVEELVLQAAEHAAVLCRQKEPEFERRLAKDLRVFPKTYG